MESYQTDHLDSPPIKLTPQLRERAQLRRADRRKVGRVREQDYPLPVAPGVEVYVAVGRLCLEVGCCGTEPQTRLLGRGGRSESAARDGYARVGLNERGDAAKDA